MPVTLPPDLANDTVADADAVMQHINALAGKFTEGVGGIGDDDFTESDGRRLDGSKIATDSIPGIALEEKAVTETKLAHEDTDSSGTDASRAVSGYHIKSLTAAHIARLLPALGIALDKLKITIATVAVSIPAVTAGIPASSPLTMGGGPYPVATWDLLGAYFKNRGGTAGVAATQITVSSSDGTTNWAFDMAINPAASGSLTGTAVAVFIAKVT